MQIFEGSADYPEEVAKDFLAFFAEFGLVVPPISEVTVTEDVIEVEKLPFVRIEVTEIPIVISMPSIEIKGTSGQINVPDIVNASVAHTGVLATYKTDKVKAKNDQVIEYGKKLGYGSRDVKEIDVPVELVPIVVKTLPQYKHGPVSKKDPRKTADVVGIGDFRDAAMHSHGVITYGKKQLAFIDYDGVTTCMSCMQASIDVWIGMLRLFSKHHVRLKILDITRLLQVVLTGIVVDKFHQHLNVRKVLVAKKKKGRNRV